MRQRRRCVALVLLGLVIGTAGSSAGQAIGNTKPVAAFRAFLVEEGASTTVLLDATLSADQDGAILQYQWVFGDGAVGSGARVRHTYSQIEGVVVSLRVVDDRGAFDSISRTMSLRDVEPGGELALEEAEPELQTGDQAPDFTLPTLDGNATELSAYLGTVVIVDFWFQSCTYCVTSLSHLREIQAQFGSSGLVIIIVVLDRDPSGPREFFSASDYASFITAHEVDRVQPTRSAYGVTGMPHAFLIDRSGVIRFSGKPNDLTADDISKWL